MITRGNLNFSTGSRGSVLILSLWALAVLAALAVASATHLIGALRLARFVDNDTQAGMAARAGVEYGLMAAVSQTGGWDRVVRLDPAGDDQPIAIGARGRVRVYHPAERMDERLPDETRSGLIGVESRINLNTASPALLAALFDAAIGDAVGSRQAAEWSQRLVTLRNEKAAENARLTNPSSIQYDVGSLGNAPTPDRPVFRSWHMVRRVARDAGIDPALMHRIRPHSTLYGNGQVNVNSAGPTVLTAVGMAAGGTPATARALAATMVAYRAAGGVFDADGDTWGAALSTQPTFDEEQRIVLQGMLRSIDEDDEQLVTIRSTCFMGTAEGWLETRGAHDRWDDRDDEAPPLTRWIDFVIRREPAEVLYWHEY